MVVLWKGGSEFGVQRQPRMVVGWWMRGVAVAGGGKREKKWVEDVGFRLGEGEGVGR